jgi:hypothetical protein
MLFVCGSQWFWVLLIACDVAISGRILAGDSISFKTLAKMLIDSVSEINQKSEDCATKKMDLGFNPSPSFESLEIERPGWGFHFQL